MGVPVVDLHRLFVPLQPVVDSPLDCEVNDFLVDGIVDGIVAYAAYEDGLTLE